MSCKYVQKWTKCNDSNAILPVETVHSCIQCFQVRDEGHDYHSWSCSSQYHLPVNNRPLYHRSNIYKNMDVYSNNINWD